VEVYNPLMRRKAALFAGLAVLVVFVVLPVLTDSTP
jgi:hypothetical protein